MYANKILHNHTDELKESGVLKITVLERVRRYLIMCYIFHDYFIHSFHLTRTLIFFTKRGLVLYKTSL